MLLRYEIDDVNEYITSFELNMIKCNDNNSLNTSVISLSFSFFFLFFRFPKTGFSNDDKTQELCQMFKQKYTKKRKEKKNVFRFSLSNKIKHR